MVTNAQSSESPAARIEAGLGALIVIMLGVIAASAVWLGTSVGRTADYPLAFVAIGAGSLGWAAATLIAWLSRWPGSIEPIATRTLVGASTVCMLTLLAGVAVLLIGMTASA